MAKNGRNAIQQCAVQALGQTFFEITFEFLYFWDFTSFLQKSMQFTGKKVSGINSGKGVSIRLQKSFGPFVDSKPVAHVIDTQSVPHF